MINFRYYREYIFRKQRIADTSRTRFKNYIITSVYLFQRVIYTALLGIACEQRLTENIAPFFGPIRTLN